jgi:hypothetical protein
MPIQPRVSSTRRRVQSRIGNWAVTVALVCGVPGCAPGVMGLVSGAVLEADGARVIVVRGYGVQLRGASSDAGLTLGYARRTYVYPNTTPDLPDPGRYYFWVPQPPSAPIAWDGRAVGFDVRMAGVNLGITLGFRGTAVLAQVPDGETVYYKLRFMPADPASTLLRFCRGEHECARFDFNDF